MTMETRFHKGERFTLDYTNSGVIEVEHQGQQRGHVIVHPEGCHWTARIECSGKSGSVDDSLNAVFDAILCLRMERAL